MGIVNIMMIIGGVSMIVGGYQVAFKYNYKLITGYQNKIDEERYPIEVEKKYLRNIGVPFILIGILFFIYPFLDKYTWFPKVFLLAISLGTVYIFTVPSYIAIKELDKFNNDENKDEDKDE